MVGILQKGVLMHSQDLLDAIDRIGKVIKSALESNIPWYQKLSKIVEAVVPEVEVIGTATNWEGADKKQLAMELIDSLYFKYLDSKYIPNFIEKMIINKVSSFLIDKFVDLMNKKGIFKHA